MAADARNRRYIIKDTHHHIEVARAVQDFNIFSKFVDIRFVCANGSVVHAHKLLLCSLSTTLKAMLLDLPDCVRLDMVTVHVPDIDSAILNLVLDFLYEGSIRVPQAKYPLVQDVMNTLGIVLTNNIDEEPVEDATPAPSMPMQTPPQVVYVPTTPNSQGQMQYVMATSAGQVLEGQQQATQPVLMAQAGVAQPVILDHVDAQMIQNGTQVMATQAQQNNLVPVMQQNQVISINNQQVMSGNQQMASSNQQITANNIQQIRPRNQRAPAPASGGVTNSSYVNRQPGPQRRGRGYQQSSPARGRPPLTNRANNTARRDFRQDILAILRESEENVDSMTPQGLKRCLEQRLNMNLTGFEQTIELALQSVRDEPTSSHVARGLRPKKKSFPFSKSDDEDDADFQPSGGPRVTYRRRRRD